MQSPVVESPETPEIRWPVPRNPRALELPDEPAETGDTRAPTRRSARERRGARLRWGLLWLSALFGGLCAWGWLARQDQIKLAQFAVERELNEFALLRADLERAPDLKAASLRIYVDKVEARRAAIDKRLEALPAESALRKSWTTELQALTEAKADLDWLQPRWLQLGVIEGAKMTDEIKANEASLRPVLDRFAAPALPHGRFRPGLARGLLVELDRRLNDVRAAAAANAPPPLPLPEKPMVLKAEKPKAVAPVRPAKALKKPAKRQVMLAKDRSPKPRDVRRSRVVRDDAGEEIIRHTRAMRARR